MIDRSLFDLLPPLRRARGDRLYGPDQKHWVDLWKQDGIWLLGHRPEGAAKEWKIQVDKGLAAWAPSHWPRRLESLVRQLVPGTRAVRVFRNADRAPAAPLWRPWEETSGFAPVVRLVLPTGPGQAVALAYSEDWTGELPDHDVTSPAEAAALVHAAAQVLRFTTDPKAVLARQTAAETFDRLIGPTGLFQRRGLWLEAVRPEVYPRVFQAHFEAGFVLNPDSQAPSLIPTALSDGEWKQWKTVAETFQGAR